MKIKLFACLMIGMAIGSQASAAEIQNGRIISHKEWSTNNVRGYFKASTLSSRLRNAMEHRLNQSSDTDTSVTLFNDVQPVVAKIGDPIIVTAGHMFYVINKSASVKDYNITYSLCADVITDGHSVDHCVNALDYVEINAGGSYLNRMESNLMLDASWVANDYLTYAEIQVSGQEGTEANIDSVASSTVTIS